MNSYAIFTDSTADIPKNLWQQWDIGVVPVRFTIENTTYYNDSGERDLTQKDFYNILRSGKTSKTAQTNVSEFIEYFEKVLEKGQDILYVGFSSGLSGTYNSSKIAVKELLEKYPERKIIAIDSLCASMGQCLLTYHAVRNRQNNISINENAELIEKEKLNVCHFVFLDDLFHLRRGGRISSATAIVGTMLGIKPIIHMNNEGKLIQVSKARGKNAAQKVLLDSMAAKIDPLSGQVVFISHADSLEYAQSLADEIKNTFNVEEIIINGIGPVIGSHTGPGGVALFFMGKDRDMQ